MGKLTIVGTSIGNIEDLSLRAIKTLFQADIVLAEDTRVFLKLKEILKSKIPKILNALNLNVENHSTLMSYRDQNHEKVFPEILFLLSQNKNIVLVSDSGMPGVSDPGFKLIRDVINEGLEVDVIPGPTAVTTAFVISGIPTDRFTFLGFLPRKSTKASKLVEKYLENENTVIIYESPFRVISTLKNLLEKLGEEIEVAACSELTKLHQNVTRGKIEEVINTLEKTSIKGEWVICLRKIT